MKVSEKELTEKQKKFENTLFYSSIFIVTCYFITHVFLKIYYPAYQLKINILFFVALAFGFSSIAIIISKSKYEFEKIYKIISSLLVVIIFYVSLYMHKYTYLVYILYVPIILLINLVTKLKTIIFIILFIILLCIITPEIYRSLNISGTSNLSKEYLQTLKIAKTILILISFYFSVIIIYYTIQFNKIIKKRDKNLNEIIETKNVQQSIDEEELFKNSIKFEHLYEQIIILLKKEKPYKDPDFNKVILAKMINTNITYVSFAINKIGNQSFNSLINDMKISDILIEFENNNHSKKSIEEIYRMYGFKHQATFNRVFKEKLGKSPTEYIDTLKKS